MRLGAIVAGVTLTAIAVGGCHKVEDSSDTQAQAAAPAADASSTDNSPWGAYSDDSAGKIIGIWTDSKTHCQYFLGNNLMTPRLGSDGRPICDATADPAPAASPSTSDSPGT